MTVLDNGLCVIFIWDRKGGTEIVIKLNAMMIYAEEWDSLGCFLYLLCFPSVILFFSLVTETEVHTNDADIFKLYLLFIFQIFDVDAYHC